MNIFWQPTAPLQNIYLRARLYQDLRQFFATRQVLEVETPILSAGCLPDPVITSFVTEYHGNLPRRLFLHTSPEFSMKRLLATYHIPIYQITKVFRDGEAGRKHNPEFTMLEWYRPGFTQNKLIEEIDDLLQTVLHCPPAQQISYCELFEQSIQLHPLQTPLATLQRYVTKFKINPVEQLDRDTCLQLIMSCDIEPQLGNTCPLVVTDFPASQAALARKNPDNPQLAERFEVYFQGLELANGFYELTDPVEQRQRFTQDLEKRHTLGLLQVPLDEHFLAALEAGLPDCAGVAVGLDRLLMIMANASHIQEVIAFPIENA